METKAFWKSKTLWYALIMLAIGILNYIQGNLEAGTMITANGIIVALLRVVSETTLVGKIKE